MVRLPARLTSKLAKARMAQIFNSAPLGPVVHCVDPTEVLHPGSAAPVSREKMHALIENPAPVIWIGGSEPLLHAGIGHFVRAIAQSGHYVFLETDGTSLRRRIHEFQPQPELFLTVRLDSPEGSEFALAVEGLRTACLSGFFTVIHTRVREDFGSAQLTRLRSFIAEKDVDGWLITAASPGQAVVRKAAEARGLIRGIFWRQFSTHLEEAVLAKKQTRESRDARTSIPIAQDDHAEAHQKGVGIS